MGLSIWSVLDSLGWTPHHAQEQVFASTARNRVVSAGRRSGKSEIGGHELVPECLLTYARREDLLSRGKRREFWIVGPNFCVDEKTEILTRQGWLTHNQVGVNDHCLGVGGWEEVRASTVFSAARRRMVQLNGLNHHSLTTENHKWVVYNTYYKDYTLVESQYLDTCDENDYIYCAIPCSKISFPCSSHHSNEKVRSAVLEGKLSYEFVNELTKSQVELIIHVALSEYGIAENSKKTIGLCKITKSELDIFQYCFQILGNRTTSYFDHYNSLYVLQVVPDNYIQVSHLTKTEMSYDGVVWCPTTVSGSWLARRGGDVFFTGNSDSEKEFRILWNSLKKLDVPFDHPGS